MSSDDHDIGSRMYWRRVGRSAPLASAQIYIWCLMYMISQGITYHKVNDHIMESNFEGMSLQMVHETEG